MRLSGWSALQNMRITRNQASAHAGMVIGIIATTAVVALIQSIYNLPNLSILYLPFIMFCAVTWGWWMALAATLLSFLAYDFLFIAPYYALTIHEPHEWIALGIFLFVAAVTSNLAARERARREQASRQARTATLLYDLSRALAGGQQQHAGLRAIADRLLTEFRLDGTVVARSDGEGRLEPLVAVGRADPALGREPVGRVFAQPGGPGHAGRWIVRNVRGSVSRSPVTNFPLRSNGQQLGMLRLVGRSEGFADDETQLLATIADRLAVDLEQETLRQEANRAELLRRTDEVRTALLSSVSHDLRTPLAAIKASAESLLHDDVEWSAEDRAGFASAIVRESDRLNRLVGNLLEMSRIEGGALRPQRDWYDLGELVREVVGRLRPLLDGRIVRLDLPDDLPPVMLDYLMIDQVVTNLLENAVKYTPAGSPIEISVVATRNHLRIAVADHGPGVPAAKRGHAFEKFYRLEQTSERQQDGQARRQPSGSGLGLAVSKGLVEAHGGRIWIDDTPGGGATMVFEVPLEQHMRTGVRPTVEAMSAGSASDGAGSGQPNVEAAAARSGGQP